MQLRATVNLAASPMKCCYIFFCGRGDEKKNTSRMVDPVFDFDDRN